MTQSRLPLRPANRQHLTPGNLLDFCLVAEQRLGPALPVALQLLLFGHNELGVLLHDRAEALANLIVLRSSPRHDGAGASKRVRCRRDALVGAHVGLCRILGIAIVAVLGP